MFQKAGSADDFQLDRQIKPMTQITEAACLKADALELERGERLLFTGLTFEAPAGTLVRLAGANGTGKTSLLRLLTGLMQPDAG